MPRYVIFFFSSRRRHTRSKRDWSSDVCSSDLFPRSYVDVNREPYELDPRMFDGRLPSFANTRSMRVAGGLGTVARVVGESQEIYDQRIPVDDALGRIEALSQPYHRPPRNLWTGAQRDFGAL